MAWIHSAVDTVGSDAWLALPHVEKLSKLRSLKAEAKSADQRASIAGRSRKIRDRNRYIRGSLVERSGLADLLNSEATLLGGLITLTGQIEADPGLIEKFQAIGAEALAIGGVDTAAKTHVVLRFEGKPDTPTKKKLRSMGGAYSGGKWTVPVTKNEIILALFEAGCQLKYHLD